MKTQKSYPFVLSITDKITACSFENSLRYQNIYKPRNSLMQIDGVVIHQGKNGSAQADWGNVVCSPSLSDERNQAGRKRWAGPRERNCHDVWQGEKCRRDV